MLIISCFLRPIVVGKTLARVCVYKNMCLREYVLAKVYICKSVCLQKCVLAKLYACKSVCLQGCVCLEKLYSSGFSSFSSFSSASMTKLPDSITYFHLSLLFSCSLWFLLPGLFFLSLLLFLFSKGLQSDVFRTQTCQLRKDAERVASKM